jgi:hypothetical protein
MANTVGVVVPSLDETESISSRCILHVHVFRKSKEKPPSQVLSNSNLDMDPQAVHLKDDILLATLLRELRVRRADPRLISPASLLVHSSSRWASSP